MRTRIFRLLDPRQEHLPTDTSRIIQKKPHRWVPLVDPSLMVQNNPAVHRMVTRNNAVEPAQIRKDLRARLGRAVEAVNRQIAQSRQFRGIRIHVDEQAGRFVAVVRNQRTGQVLRQIPSEEMLEMSARLKDVSGLFKDITI